MDIIIDSFLIFTGLMFWIVFYNKKGLLAEIKKTEKKISEKIIVLEDLLDLTAKKKTETESATKISVSESTNNLKTKSKAAKKNRFIKPVLNKKLNLNAPQEIIKPDYDTEENKSNTEFRTLSISDAEKIDLDEKEVIDKVIQKTTENLAQSISASIASSKFFFEENENSEEDSNEPDSAIEGVKTMVLEARENLKKIDVPESLEIKSFKDVVLMAKRMEQEKK